jgi:D-sedoheptulose 7-phosphate isomerase
LDKLEDCEESNRLKTVLEGNLPAISLTSHVSLTTAYSNDKEPSAVFAQQLLGLGNEGDTFIAISTSGNSLNCVYACLVAKAKGLKTVSLTGEKESRLSQLSSVTVKVPEKETYKIQELHLPLYHALCAMLEEEFFD